MNEYDKYIDELKEKIDKTDDIRLRYLVNKLIEEREYLANNIMLDPLTGLFNRRALDNVRDCSVLVLCDVDNFKSVNDTLGHDVGDLVLKKVAQILQNYSRRIDCVCRYGGDEFLIAFSNVDLQLVTNRMNLINEEVRKIEELIHIPISLSIGIAEHDINVPLSETITHADESLYQSKNNGKNQITIYDSKKKTLK